MRLYRPVGLEELRLIFASGMTAFPPRLPEQPIFYPVTNRGYAVQIARDWNARSGTLAGYVTSFAIDDDYAAGFPIETVGARDHQELWVPADQLAEFNRHLAAPIAVLDAFFGAGFRGLAPTSGALRGRDAVAQLITLAQLHRGAAGELRAEVAANPEVIFAHLPFWRSRSFGDDGVSDPARAALLDAIRQAWAEVSPGLALAHG